MSQEKTSGAAEIAAARALWGDETAQIVIGGVIKSVLEADTLVRPHASVDTLQIQYADIPERYPNGVPIPRMVGLHTKMRGFSLLLDKRSPNEIVQLTKAVVLHETARVHVFQNRVKEGHYKNNNELGALGIAVEDGMVVCATESLIDPAERPDADNYMSYGLEPDVITSWIRKFIVLGTGPISNEDEHKLRFGDVQLPRAGYKIGHAIVRSAMDTYDLSPVEMLRKSPAFYAEHAQHMVSA